MFKEFEKFSLIENVDFEDEEILSHNAHYFDNKNLITKVTRQKK